MGNKKLYKSRKDKRIFGVCGGIAEYLNVSSVFVRILWIVGIFASFGTGIFIYFIAAFIMPKESKVARNINPNEVIEQKF